MDNLKKIEKINSDRVIILNNIKEKLLNAHSFNDDALITEKDKSISKAKEIIVYLTNEISHSHDIEEIKKLRRTVNYYINKIKKEMHNRGINEEKLATYQDATSYLRKGMSQYISYLKRVPKLDDINNLNNNFDIISDSDKSRLKKLLTNELRYNREVLKKQDTSVKVNKCNNQFEEFDKWVKTEFRIAPKKKEKDDFVEWLNTEFNVKKERDDDGDFTRRIEEDFRMSEIEHHKIIPFNGNIGEYIDSIKTFMKSDYTTDVDMEASLKRKINYYKKKYGIRDTKNYGNSVIKNMVIFLDNIPKYIGNKKAIKLMRNDYKMYFLGNDLRNYIDYTEKSNSIGRSFGQVMHRSALAEPENQCLNDHNRCLEWINNYKTKKKALEKSI